MKGKKYHNLYCVFFIIRKMPWFVAATLIRSMLVYLSSLVMNVFLLQKVLNIIENGADFLRLAYWLCGVIVFLVASDIYKTFYNEVWAPKFDLSLEKTFYHEIFEKAVSIDILYFDDPKYYNEYVFSSESIVESAKKALTLTSDVISCIISVVLVAVSYSQRAISLYFFIVVSIGLTFVMKSLSVKISHHKDLDLVAPRRRASYFKDVFFTRDSVKERLISDVDILLKDKYQKSIEEQISIQKKYNRRLSAIDWTTNYFCNYVMLGIGVIAFLLYQLVSRQTILLSEFVPLYRAADIVASSFREVFAIKVPGLMNNAKRIQKYRTFIDLKNEKINSEGYHPSEDPEPIELKDISFAYPNSGTYALKGINMFLEPGRVVALVGRNGAGKSTLASVLTGLMKPTSGDMVISGHPLSEVNLYAYRQKFNIVFQNDQLLNVTIGENLALDREYDPSRVDFSTTACGMSLKDKNIIPETFVGREIFDDGVIFSGGEVQKMLLARCVYRNLPYIVMDEPSSALDAKAEYEFNNILAEIARREKKTILVITHRLTTITMADYIYVMDEGRIVEQGVFHELKDSRGLFAKMWETQSVKYSLND